jgi:hypothetical protein
MSATKAAIEISDTRISEVAEPSNGAEPQAIGAEPQTNETEPSRLVQDLEVAITFADSSEERARNEETLAIMTAPPEPDFDLIENYTKFADRFETPGMIHELLAISAIGALANKAEITFEYAGRSTPIDLWIIAIMASGTGKNEALNLLMDVLAKAGMLDLVTRSSWGSPEACSEQLAARPTNFFVFTEAAILLAKLNSSRWALIKPLITDTYDSNNIPPAIKHRTNSKGTTNTPDIEFTRPLRNSFLLMSNRDWLQQQLREYDATGGWLARFLWVAVPDADRAIHKVPLGDAVLETRLKNKLLRISKLQGEADTTAIYTDDPECAYAKWYLKTRARWKRQGPLGEVFWGRWRASVLKLAIVFEISRTESLKVSVESFNRAAAWMDSQETAIFKLLRSEFSSDAGRLDKKENFFIDAGVGGRTKTEYTDKFRYEEPRRRNGDLETLIDSGTIRKVAERVGPDGKKMPPTYVHQDFVHQDFVQAPPAGAGKSEEAGAA